MRQQGQRASPLRCGPTTAAMLLAQMRQGRSRSNLRAGQAGAAQLRSVAAAAAADLQQEQGNRDRVPQSQVQHSPPLVLLLQTLLLAQLLLSAPLLLSDVHLQHPVGQEVSLCGPGGTLCSGLQAPCPRLEMLL